MEKFYRRLSEILALILYGYLRTFAMNGNKDVNVMYILYIYIFGNFDYSIWLFV